jgi:hypothetical protein
MFEVGEESPKYSPLLKGEREHGHLHSQVPGWELFHYHVALNTLFIMNRSLPLESYSVQLPYLSFERVIT